MDFFINNNNGTFLGAVNLYNCYTLDWWSRDLDTDFTLGNGLFRSVKLNTKINTNITATS